MKFAISLVVAALLIVVPASAQEDEASVEANGEASADNGTRTCLSTRRIRHTRIVDDRNVLYFLSGRTVFLNVLRKSCQGLKQVGSFAYASNNGQVCKDDGIALIGGALGAMRPVPVCWLGIHRQITRDQADIMMDAAEQRFELKPMPIPLPEPSEIGAEGEEPVE